MPLSDGEAEPTRGVRSVNGPRFGEPVARIQIQPAALWATEKHASVLVGGNLFDMAVVHVLVVAAVIATPVIHTHEGSPWVSATATFRS